MNYIKRIDYPFLPNNKLIRYVPKDDPFILIAKQFSKKYSKGKITPYAVVIVKEGRVIGSAADRGEYEDGFKNHPVPFAIRDVDLKENPIEGADLYLWGHWWFCNDCWDVMNKARIKGVYLMEDSEILFNKDHPDNIIGRQFE